MTRRLFQAVLGFFLALGGQAFAQDAATCAGCGQPGAQCMKEGCTCASSDGGACPTHRGMGGGMGMGMHHGMGMMRQMPAFDPKTVGRFRGTVTAVERVAHGQGFVGVHLKVQAGAEQLVVHLGPASFVDPKMTFAAKDEVELSGSKVTFQGEPIVLATTVKKGGKSIELRKDDGTPLFRGPPT